MPKKPLTKKEKQMRTGAVARQNMFLGGLTPQSIADMVSKYQTANPAVSANSQDTTLAADSKVSDPFGTMAYNSTINEDGTVNAGGDGTDFGAAVQANNTGSTAGNTAGNTNLVSGTAAAASGTAAASDTGKLIPIGQIADASDSSAILNTLGAGSSGTDILGKFADSGLSNEEIYDLLYTSVQNNPNSPFAAGAQSLLSTMKMNPETGKNEFFQTTDNNNQKTVSADKPNTSPQWVEISRVDNGNRTETVSFQDQNPLSASYNKIVTDVRNIGDGGDSDGSSNGGTGTGAGTGTGTGTGGNDGRFGDVLNQYDQMAGLTGTNPNLPETAKVKPTDMAVQPGELETTAGVQLGATQQAATEIISDAQIQALQAAGYTLKSTADTVAGTTSTIADVTNQALNAQTLSALTDTVDPITGKPVVGESIIGQIPDRESIDQVKATGLAATDMNGADRTKTPTVGDFTGNFNEKVNAAQRSITTNEIVQPIDPATANQGTAQVMAELRDNAVMEAAQSSTDEQTRATANAITQQMSEVPVEATVQGQLTNLMAQFADGKTPAYAAGAIRNAEAQMAARGLSASSMAGGAIMQAAMESSLPIAAQDAQVFREINLSNINNKQKVALANQAAALQISLSDLSNRQQTKLQNSTNAYSLQSQSLSNMQQSSLANAQLRASLQERELGFEQQRQVVNATRYAEIEGINLNNQQQGVMQDSVNNMQVSMSNMSFKQQRELSKAQIDAALTGQELTNDQQAAVVNAARVAEVNNLTFNEEQQRNLNDSQLMQNMTLANLDSEMKTALSNAATYASMETASLNNRQQAQVVNAQSFLNLDMASLSNKQQGEVLKYQAKTNAMFTDAAADNARLQFNAQSENQVDEFFAQLGSSTAQQNSNRVAAMKQFNSDQTNSTAKFNASLVDTREQFNSSMTTQINQSNATWRRQINTANSAAQNEANRTNALNTFGMNQNALNNIWQQYRDEASWLFKQDLTREQFAHELTKINLTADRQFQLYDRTVTDNAYGAGGSWAYDLWAQKQLDKQSGS